MSNMQATSTSPVPAHQSQIVLAHGGGGQLTDDLIAAAILPRLGNTVLAQLTDAGVVAHGDRRLALTIDGYVVQPMVFPGGDIGRLAVCGTVNDLAVSGAEPVGLALSLILEEGLDRGVLDQVLDSLAATAREADVKIITGDTKVVAHGQGDGVYITTAGVGVVPAQRRLGAEFVQPGDVLIINGPIADHGLAVMLAREMPDVRSAVRSDVAPLNRLIQAAIAAAGDGLVFMRDPTRSGLAGLAADLAARSGWHVTLEESAIPVRPETRHAAEMLGLDVLEVANEGKVVMVVRPGAAEAVLAALRDHTYGRDACVVGRVDTSRDGLCEIQTAMGGRRIVQKPYGEQLPRIC